MLYLKKINYDDIEEEFSAIKSMPQNENGFENKYYNINGDGFETMVKTKDKRLTNTPILFNHLLKAIRNLK